MANDPGDQVPQDPTKLPTQPGSGLEQVLPLVYDQLRAIARSAMRRETPAHTLDATTVVNEAYLRMRDQRNLNLQDRSQFFAMASTMIRRVLVDHARAKGAVKRRGPGERLSLNDVDVASAPGEASLNVSLVEARSL